MFKRFDDDYAGAGKFRLEPSCPGLRPSGAFTADFYDKYRPTVALLGIYEGQGVLIVESSKRSGKEDKPSRILPQGGVEWGHTIPSALATEISEELGIDYSRRRLQQLWDSDQLVVIGGYTNTSRGDDKPKYIVTVAMPMSNPGRIILNFKENVWWDIVRDQEELRDCLVNTRPVKRLGIYHAIIEAHNQGLLNWSCEDVLREMVTTVGVAAVA